MTRNYKYVSLEDKGFNAECRMLERGNSILIGNFNKIAEWIKTNCPQLNGKFDCEHNPYYWISLVVEDGKAYLEEGSHGYGFSTALSTTETAVFSRGSEQSVPYAFAHLQFFPNKRLEEFLKQWSFIKKRVIAEDQLQQSVYSTEFQA